MTASRVLQDLVALVGADVALAPSAALLEKHTSDYCVQGRRDVGVMALVFVEAACGLFVLDVVLRTHVFLLDTAALCRVGHL